MAKASPPKSASKSRTTSAKKQSARAKTTPRPHEAAAHEKPRGVLGRLRRRMQDFLRRRPHRSFRRSRRRDYVRPLRLPGYWALTGQVARLFYDDRKLFILMALLYSLLTAALVGLSSQDTYTALTDLLRDTGEDIFTGNWGAIGQAGLILATVMSGGITQTLTDVQQVYAGFLLLMTWLTTVWLLRNRMAGHMVRLRDGVYNAGAPIISTFMVLAAVFIQLIPLAFGFIVYSAANSSGLLAGGVEAMLGWMAIALLVTLSLYWLTSTLIALVVVTLPGMYPWQAIRTAGDMVSGRRLRILYRILWLLGLVLLVWIAVMLPIILLDTWLKGVWTAIAWVPSIPVAILLMSSLTTVWCAGYIYVLYRRIVADDAKPA